MTAPKMESRMIMTSGGLAPAHNSTQPMKMPSVVPPNKNPNAGFARRLGQNDPSPYAVRLAIWAAGACERPGEEDGWLILPVGPRF